jgi:hypothetical protein
MAIAVICPGCQSRFSVSDQFAGRTGPCPKCKKSITIPAVTAEAVVIHEPEAPVTTAAGTGRAPTAPIRRVEKPISTLRFAAVGVAAVAALAVAWATGLMVKPAELPAWLLLAAAFVTAVPCVMLGYAAVRNRELEPFTGTPFLLRSLACAAVYAGLWAVKGMLPPEATAEMWQWVYLTPLFVGSGALAALVAFELEWGSAVAHFSLYAIFTALLRWLVGLPPL